jgi:hypothetical protein
VRTGDKSRAHEADRQFDSGICWLLEQSAGAGGFRPRALVVVIRKVLFSAIYLHNRKPSDEFTVSIDNRVPGEITLQLSLDRSIDNHEATAGSMPQFRGAAFTQFRSRSAKRASILYVTNFVPELTISI